MIDTHAHLLDSYQDYSFYRPVNFHTVLSMSTHRIQWVQNQHLARDYPEVYYAVGIHPWFVNDQSLSELATLETFFHDSQCISVGEIGLDFSPKHKKSKHLQIEVFQQQCVIAAKYNRPVSIHAIKCHNEMLQILKSHHLTGVIHGLSASKEVCRSYLDLGFQIGVNALVCNLNAKRVREMVSHFPLDSYVLESDFPNISESFELNAIVDEISLLTGRSKAEVLKKTTYNAQRIFKFGK